MSCKPVIQATREVRGIIATVIDEDFAAHPIGCEFLILESRLAIVKGYV
jgi:hypothetical protein